MGVPRHDQSLSVPVATMAMNVSPSPSLITENVNAPGSGVTQRLHLLEGLRGYMAWWVVLGHYMVESGFRGAWLPSLGRIVTSAGYAVDVFVILSGFVITHLLSTQPVSYREFITRRFFRLYPLFLAALIVGLVTFHAVHGDYFRFAKLVQSDAQTPEMWTGYQNNLVAHTLVSLTMLHGAIPSAWLPNAQAALVSPAWSVSLEWQFYLVFPALLWAFQRYPYGTAGAVLIAMGVQSHITIGDWGSFLPQHAEFFLLGILSYHLFQFLKRAQLKTRQNVPWVLLTLFLVLTMAEPLRDLVFRPYQVAAGGWLPLAIWAITLALLVETHAPTPSAFPRVLAAVFLNPVAQWLGKVSYSTYLIHYFVIYLIMACLLRSGVAVNKYTSLAAMVVLGTPLLLALSWLSHTCIEKPGITVGRLVCGQRWFAAQRLETHPAPAHHPSPSGGAGQGATF